MRYSILKIILKFNWENTFIYTLYKCVSMYAWLYIYISNLKYHAHLRTQKEPCLKYIVMLKSRYTSAGTMANENRHPCKGH